MTSKVCKSCKETKSLEQFYAHKLGKFGVDSRCKSCKKTYDAERRNTDEYRVKHAAEMQKWRTKNPEKYAAYVEANREKIRENSKLSNRKNRYADPARYLWYRTKATAKTKKLPFNIEPSDIVIPSQCPVLGIPIQTGLRGCSPNLANVDRIIPEKGYVKGNICVISFRANRIKCDASLEELKALVRYIEKETASQSDQAPCE